MPEPHELTSGLDRLVDPLAGAPSPSFAGSPEDELAGPDRTVERAALYVILFTLLVAGSLLLRDNLFWETGSATHSVLEAIATVLAFIVGGLSLVRFYSRKQITFLLIGTGFLGAALLNLNHALITSEVLINARVAVDPVGTRPADLFAWSWTAERVFLSLFLFVSLLAWRQEVREGAAEMAPEGTVYGTALVLTVLNLLFFEWVPLEQATFPTHVLSRRAELLPALFFLLAFVGFLHKGDWKRDAFEHWLLVSLLISVMAHGAFMAFSDQRYDAMYDAAHLLKIASYVAILTGLLFSVYTTFRREGQVLGALTESNEALAREIAVRARTEQAVKESSARLQDFLDNANDLIQSVSPEGRILYVNSSWKRVLGYTDEDLERTKLFDIVHPAHRGQHEQELGRVLEGGDPERFNVEYVAADGRIVILSGSAQAQYVRGEAVGTQGILRDVTEQRLAERQLDESRANLAALVENTGDSIWSVDRQHKLITLNSAFSLAMEARTGSEPKVGQLPAEVFAQEDVAWYEAMYDRTLSGERHVALRTDAVDGQLRYFELYANPIHSLEGISGAVVFGKDVTPRVRAEEALRVAKDEAEAANKAKSHFLANMSHELRTPLNSVIGFTNILLKNKGDRLNEKDLGFLQRVLSNGKHLLALINEVLDLAKVEAGRMELIIEQVDLADLVVETVQQLEGQARTKDGAVALLADVPESVSPVETDSAKLKQVIINLVGNALKFTHEGSVTVRLELAPDGRTPVAVSVVDTGIGIPAERLDAIFEAFQQAEAGTSRKYGGTGLGLALSRSICLLMGYDLIVESEVEKGSTFKIVLGERALRPGKMDDEEAPPAAEEAGRAAAGAERAGAEAAGAVSAGSRAGRAKAAAPGAAGSRVAFPVAGAEPQAPQDGRSAQREDGPSQPGDGRAAGDDGRTAGDDGRAAGEDRRSAGEDRRSASPAARSTAADGADAATRPPREHARGRQGYKVLVVDDEKDSRVLIGHYLEEFGCHVLTANSGEDGITAAREHAPDLITLDLIMPGMTGWEMLKRLKGDSELRHIPVVVVSVVAGEGRGRLLGAVDLVTKPFEREDLLRVVWRHLGRKRAGRVLVVADALHARSRLSETLRDRGLEVVTASDAMDGLEAIRLEAPDAVVLDLNGTPAAQTSFLHKVRQNRIHVGLPVFVLSDPGLSDPDKIALGDLATVVVTRNRGLEELSGLLDTLFPPTGHREAPA